MGCRKGYNSRTTPPPAALSSYKYISCSLKVDTPCICPLHSTSSELQATLPQNYSSNGTYDKFTSLSHYWHRTGIWSRYDTRTTIQTTSTSDTKCVGLTVEARGVRGSSRLYLCAGGTACEAGLKQDVRTTSRERQHVAALCADRRRSCHHAGTALGPVRLATTEASS